MMSSCIQIRLRARPNSVPDLKNTPPAADLPAIGGAHSRAFSGPADSINLRRNYAGVNRVRTLPSAILDRLFGLAIEGALTERVPLVMKLFATHERNFDLDPVAFEERAQRHHSEPLFLDL